MQFAQTQPADFASHCPFRIETASESDSEVVCIVEDDAPVRDALANLLASLGRAVRTFGSAGECLAWYRRDSAACLILDMLLPDMHGLELQRRLALTGSPTIIFISGEVDIPCTVRAIKAGAVEFLTKPLNSQALESAIHAALIQDRERRRLDSEREARQARLATLTLASGKCFRLWLAVFSTNRPPPFLEFAKSPCRFIAARSCARWPRARSRNWSDGRKARNSRGHLRKSRKVFARRDPPQHCGWRPDISPNCVHNLVCSLSVLLENAEQAKPGIVDQHVDGAEARYAGVNGCEQLTEPTFHLTQAAGFLDADGSHLYILHFEVVDLTAYALGCHLRRRSFHWDRRTDA
jgi:FixJ family two-component response regulator